MLNGAKSRPGSQSRPGCGAVMASFGPSVNSPRGRVEQKFGYEVKIYDANPSD